LGLARDKKNFFFFIFCSPLSLPPPGQRDESLIILAHILRGCGELIKPYTEQILEVLLTPVTAPDPSTVAFALRSLGELSRSGWTVINKNLDKLLGLITTTLQDQSSSLKRLEALRTLSTIVRNTGYSVTPFEDHPRLLSCLLEIMKIEESQEIKTEAVRF
jgi:FKBP12-rapamycin complex-associated protein